MTISFDGLAFLTGNLGSCTFLPPGKVSDYFGFPNTDYLFTGAKKRPAAGERRGAKS
jgi:hypothetical protein